jgi:hypothetical protein
MRACANLAQIEKLYSGEQLVAKIPNHALDASSCPKAVKFGSTRRISMTVPFLEHTQSGFNPFGLVEYTGPTIAPDFAAHKDSRPKDVLNVHHTVRGGGIAVFAAVDDGLLDGYSEVDLSQLSADIPLLRIEFSAGDSLLFLGGMVVHQFISSDLRRLSIVRAFRPKLS